MASSDLVIPFKTPVLSNRPAFLDLPVVFRKTTPPGDVGPVQG